METQFLVIQLNPEYKGLITRSEFPHPLVTVDYDSDDNPFRISAHGPEAERLSRSIELFLLAYATRPWEDYRSLTGKQWE